MSAPSANPGSATAPTHVLSWSHPKTSGTSPPPRWGHSSSSLLPSLFFFGGCSGGRGVEEVVELDVERMVWRRVETKGEGPGPRDSHSCVGRGGEMIVFGGTDGRKKVNDVHILDLNSMEWVKVECGGESPAARESHSGTLVGGDKLVVFGGNGGGDEGKCLNDLHILDLHTMVWSSPKVHGTPPAPRDSHCAVALGSRLVVYGGDSGDRYHDDVHVFNMVTYTWTKMHVFGRSPGPRAGHSAVCIETKIYITGGVGDNHYHNDVWVLDVGECSWTELGIHGGKLQGRFSHVASVVGSNIVIYGGCGEDERPLDELILLRPTTDHHDEFANMPFFKMLGKPSSAESSSCSGRRNQDRSNAFKWKKGGNRVPELESRHDFKFFHDNRRRSAEMNNEEGEHSLSLPRNSSPVSQSDQEHPRAYKAKEPTFLSRGFRPKPKKTQNSSCNFGEMNDQRNRKRLLHHSGDGQACSTASRSKHNDSPGFQSLVGAEIRGKVDAAFESGFLMTATVDGRLLRGVLFEPAPRSVGNLQNSPASWAEFSQRFGNFGQICVESKEKEGKKCMGRETNDRRSDLQGVLLTLGGPTSCSD